MMLYDDQARLAFHFAREEGESLGQSRISPAHLLVALLRTQGGTSEVLAAQGASLEGWRGALQALKPGEARGPDESPRISPAARQLMEQAASLARRQGSPVTAPQHILLALLDVAEAGEDRVVGRLLALLPVSIQSLRELVLALPLPEHLPERAARSPEALAALRALIQQVEQGGDLSPDSPSRAELLGIVLTSGAEALLGDLEPLVYGWLTGTEVSEHEKHVIVTQILALALHRSS